MENYFLSDSVQSTARKQLMEQAERTLAEWKTAENFLNYASDPDIVECAIFDLEAARKKYAFIVKKLREQSEA